MSITLLALEMIAPVQWLEQSLILPFLGIGSQMSGQVSRGSAGEYQADEQAGVARLSWRVSGR